MLGGLMTRETPPRQPSNGAFASVHVVAGRAGQVRAGAKTPAAAQQLDLIAVDVRDRNVLGRWTNEIVVELLARSVRERRPSGVPLSGMAQRAIVHLAI